MFVVEFDPAQVRVQQGTFSIPNGQVAVGPALLSANLAKSALVFYCRAPGANPNEWRHFAVEGFPGERAVEQRLWQLAELLLPATDIEPYIQGLMDLGATVCTTRAPQCGRCPLQASCAALAQNRVAALPAGRCSDHA